MKETLFDHHSLFRNGPIVIFVWENEVNWPVRFATGNLHDLLGYPADDFLSGKILYSDLIHPDDLPWVEEEVRHHLASTSEAFTHQPYRLVTKGLDIIWVEDHTFIQRNPAGRAIHFIGYLVDISKQKETEEKLRRNELRLGLIVEETNIGTWDWHIPSGEFIVNDRWAALVGEDLNDIEPCIDGWKKRLHPDEKSAAIRRLM